MTMLLSLCRYIMTYSNENGTHSMCLQQVIDKPSLPDPPFRLIHHHVPLRLFYSLHGSLTKVSRDLAIGTTRCGRDLSLSIIVENRRSFEVSFCSLVMPRVRPTNDHQWTKPSDALNSIVLFFSYHPWVFSHQTWRDTQRQVRSYFSKWWTTISIIKVLFKLLKCKTSIEKMIET